MGRSTAILKVDAELLKRALKLPPGTEIVAVQEGWWAGGGLGSIRLRIEHPDLKPVEPGQAIPDVEALFRCEIIEARKTYFAGWQQ